MLTLTVETTARLRGDGFEPIAIPARNAYPRGVALFVDFSHRFAGTDPWGNLAREEIFLEDLPAGASALLLYVNSPCIVLGKHQNPLREVRLAAAAEKGVPLLRRSSGGGTVWHDQGNLNWSFLLPKISYDRAAVSETVAAAIKPLGLALTVGEKGDLFLEDKKVAGAAYLFRRDRVMHHGTLLCQARLDDLRGVLGPTGELTEWVGVSSRPMSVTNLGISVENAAQALAQCARSAVAAAGSPDFERRVGQRAQELRAASWVWDQTPPFTWKGQTLLGEVHCRVREGLIEEAWDDRSQIMGNIVGKRFFGPELFESIGEAR